MWKAGRNINNETKVESNNKNQLVDTEYFLTDMRLYNMERLGH